MAANAVSRRAAGVIGVGAPILASVAILVAGVLTPGYDPLRMTVSRLAEAGSPAAGVAGQAVYAVGFTIFVLANALGPRAVAGRLLLATGGCGLIAGAWIRLDSASAQITALHRAITAVSMLALTAAMLAFAPAFRERGERVYGWLSLAFGATAIATLLVGLVLVPSDFAAWGVWERAFLAIPLGWVVAVSLRLLGSRASLAASVPDDETTRATAATTSSGDS